MVSSDSIAVFVPILFLLVIELANIARDTVKLPELANKGLSPLSFRGRQRVFGYEILPNLGRLLFIHWGSMMLLSMTTFIALILTDGILQSGLLFATAILLYLYPVFEISEYDELFTAGQFPSSYWNHILYVTVLLVLSGLAPVVLTALDILGIGGLGLVYLGVIFTGVPFLAARSFTIRLREELEPASESVLTDQPQATISE